MPTKPPFPVLVFSKTSGYRHTCIPAALSALQQLSTSTGLFTLHATEDSSIFTPSSLSTYSVIILLQCIGDIFSKHELAALKSFVRNGGGVVAIHGAAAGMPEDEWYGKLIGAHFDMHPPAEVGNVLVDNDDEQTSRAHFCLPGSAAGGRQGWRDEWYNFQTHPRDNKNLTVLLRGDVGSFQGGKMGEDHPLVWCQEFEGGRSWLTALGHFDEAYGDEWFVGQILRAILWVGRHEGWIDGVAVG
ncbi:Nn.00g052870.m01.CDS01 [Neocucurbitaria sp. VM-36]